MTQVARRLRRCRRPRSSFRTVCWSLPRDHGPASDSTLSPLAHNERLICATPPRFPVDEAHTARTAAVRDRVQPDAFDLPRISTRRDALTDFTPPPAIGPTR